SRFFRDLRPARRRNHIRVDVGCRSRSNLRRDKHPGNGPWRKSARPASIERDHYPEGSSPGSEAVPRRTRGDRNWRRQVGCVAELERGDNWRQMRLEVAASASPESEGRVPAPARDSGSIAHPLATATGSNPNRDRETSICWRTQTSVAG